MAVRGFAVLDPSNKEASSSKTSTEVMTESSGKVGAPVNNNIATYDQAIQDARGKLTALLNQYPDVDYAGKYMELINQTEQREVPERPLSTPGQAILGFAHALGAPENAPREYNRQIMRHEKAVDDKQRDSQRLREALLEGSIQEEIRKGNFKMALKQSDALAELQRATADRERALNLADWEVKQKTKTADAQTLLRQKTQNIVSAFNLDGKMKLKVMDFAQRLLVEKMRQKSILGTPTEDIPSDDLLYDILPQVEDFAESLVTGGKFERPKDDPPPTPPKSPYREALEKRRAAQGKK